MRTEDEIQKLCRCASRKKASNEWITLERDSDRWRPTSRVDDQHGIGVAENTRIIKKIDSDYFESSLKPGSSARRLGRVALLGKALTLVRFALLFRVLCTAGE